MILILIWILIYRPFHGLALNSIYFHGWSAAQPVVMDEIKIEPTKVGGRYGY